MPPSQVTKSITKPAPATFQQTATAFGLIFFGFAALTASSYLCYSGGSVGTDGMEVLGFPFVFWKSGGYAGVQDFQLSVGLIDLAVATITALTVAKSIAPGMKVDGVTIPRIPLSTLLLLVGILGVALGAVVGLPRLARVAASILLEVGPLVALAVSYGVTKLRNQVSWIAVFAFVLPSILVVVLASTLRDAAPLSQIALYLFAYWTPQLWAIAAFQLVRFSSAVD